MLNKLMEKLQNLQKTITPFDPAELNDPVALETEWGPAKGGGTNFKTHNLVKVHDSRIEFKAALGAKLFCLVFLLIGLGIMFGFSYEKFLYNTFRFELDTILPICMGLIFASIGGGLLYFGIKPIIFDKNIGYFWKGWKSPRDVFDKNRIKHISKLEEIHAIQIITEFVKGSRNSSGGTSQSYYSYEINLVLKDASRINVVDHGKKTKILEDAETLASFLEVPLWKKG